MTNIQLVEEWWDRYGDKTKKNKINEIINAINNLTITDININSDIVPAADNSYDLGSSSKRWKDGYFAGNLNINGYGNLGSLRIGGTEVIDSSRNLKNIASGEINGNFNVGGKLGVGISSPTEILEVEGNKDYLVTFRNNYTTTWIHILDVLAPNMGSGQRAILHVGKARSTRNLGYMGFEWKGDQSTDNRLFFGLWGVDFVLNIWGDGRVTTGGNLNVGGDYIVNQSLAFFQRATGKDILQLVFNAYYDGAWHFIDDTKASYLFQLDEDAGAFEWYYAAAGSTSWTLLMQLLSNGDLKVSGNLIFNTANSRIDVKQGFTLRLDKDYEGTYKFSIARSDLTEVHYFDEEGDAYHAGTVISKFLRFKQDGSLDTETSGGDIRKLAYIDADANHWITNRHLNGDLVLACNNGNAGGEIEGIRIVAPDGYVRIKQNMLFWSDAGIGDVQYVGMQAKTADNFHFHILPCDNAGTLIANYGYLGNSSYYWYALFANYVRYKTLSSFEQLNDIELLKNIKTTVEEVEEVVDGKTIKVQREVWEKKTMQHVLDESGEFIDAGKLNGFFVGVLKQLVEKIELIEEKLSKLERRFGM